MNLTQTIELSFAPDTTSSIKTKLQINLERFERGAITKDQFLGKAQRILTLGYERAYKKGGGVKAISSEGREWISAHAESQFEYLEAFATAIEQGTTVMGTAQRMAMYADATKAAYWSGVVIESDPDAQIDWVTSAAESCEDCLELEANSPYSPEELPSVPGDGATECKGNCKCSLVRSR